MDEEAPAPPQAPQRPPTSTEAAREAARRIQQATAEVARNFREMVAPSAPRRAADPRPGSGPPVPGSPVGENPPARATRWPGGTPAARLATPEDAANHAVLVVQLAAAVVRLARRVANGDDRPAAWGGLSENAIRNMRRLSDALVGHPIGVPLLQALRRSCGRVFVVSSVSRASAYEAAVEVSRRAICAATDRLPTELHPGLDGSGECTWTDSEVAAALTRLVSERADLCSIFDAAGVDRLVAEVRLESARAEAPRQPSVEPPAVTAAAAAPDLAEALAATGERQNRKGRRTPKPMTTVETNLIDAWATGSYKLVIDLVTSDSAFKEYGLNKTTKLLDRYRKQLSRAGQRPAASDN